jgi:hypothetical protein
MVTEKVLRDEAPAVSLLGYRLLVSSYESHALIIEQIGPKKSQPAEMDGPRKGGASHTGELAREMRWAYIKPVPLRGM